MNENNINFCAHNLPIDCLGESIEGAEQIRKVREAFKPPYYDVLSEDDIREIVVRAKVMRAELKEKLAAREEVPYRNLSPDQQNKVRKDVIGGLFMRPTRHSIGDYGRKIPTPEEYPEIGQMFFEEISKLIDKLKAANLNLDAGEFNDEFSGKFEVLAATNNLELLSKAIEKLREAFPQSDILDHIEQRFMNPDSFFTEQMKEKCPLLADKLDLRGMRAFLWLLDYVNLRDYYPDATVDEIAEFTEGLIQERENGAEVSKRVFKGEAPRYARVLAHHTQIQPGIFGKIFIKSPRHGSGSGPELGDDLLSWDWK